MSSRSLSQNRVIRVFVSSTFRDMQAERDELVLRIFPQLRKLCESRGVTWGEVDLRWGISDEQKAEGKVLPICLEEIKRCRPYFIGLLGERYGWIPDGIPPEVIQREPWLAEHLQGKKSVTELEILHGVLNDPGMTDHAFFYFRDPRFVETVPLELRSNFLSEDADSAEKLRQLKEGIRQRARDGELLYEPRENFADAKALGALILDDFTALIDTIYPPGPPPSPLERDRMDHEAFARSRAGVYIGRREYFDRLDAHAVGDGPPLVVLGESGGGKSALLANWALLHREQHPQDFVLLHFIGSSPDSANATGLQRRIMRELKQRFDLPDELPTQQEKIREAFPDWLAKVAGRGRMVLVLDALNQLEDVDHAPDLGWLPRIFPKYCRVIVSTLPGRSLTAIKQRGWLEATHPLHVQPLDKDERRKLVAEFLGQFSHDLGPARTDRFVNEDQTANPLYLRALLDELRLIGVHEKLDEQLGQYLAATTPKELYLKILARWEGVYSEDCAIVTRSMALIWAARRGLAEAELLDLLGRDGKPLPRALWTPFFLAVESALAIRSGLLSFAHDYLRQAVASKYLRDSGTQRAHRELADYFARQQDWTSRKLDEFPWQLAASGECRRLLDALTAQECFLGLQERDPFELLGYWLQLKPRFDVGTSYTAAFARWERNQAIESRVGFLANQLASFLYEQAACHTAAEPLMRRALAISERSDGKKHLNVATRLSNLAMLLKDTNRMAESELLMRRALEINLESYAHDHPNVAICLNNLALLLLASDRVAKAEPMLRLALEIDEKYYGREHPKVALRLNNLSAVLKETNRLLEAEQSMRRALQIVEMNLGSNSHDVAVMLNGLASVLYSTNRLAEAELLIHRGIEIHERTLGSNHPHVAVDLNNLAQLFQATNRLSEAESLTRRSLAIREQAFGFNHPSVATLLNNLAQLFKSTNRLADAAPLMRRSLAIMEQSLGAEHSKVALALNNLARLLQATHQLVEAEPLMARAVLIVCNTTRRTGHRHPQLLSAVDNYWSLLEAMGLPEKVIFQRLLAAGVDPAWLKDE